MAKFRVSMSENNSGGYAWIGAQGMDALRRGAGA